MPRAAPIEGWVERNDRHEVELQAVALRGDGTSLPIAVRNLSYDGCLVVSGTMLWIGERITLALPRMGEVKAQVRWASADGKAGVRFILEGISPDKHHSPVGL